METTFFFQMADQPSYLIMQFLTNGHNQPDSWPVEEFDQDGLRITMEPVDAQQEEVLDFVRLLESEGQQLAASRPELCEFIAQWRYVLEGSTLDEDDLSVGYRVERTPEGVTIQETAPFSFRGSMYYDSYEEFAEEFGALCEEEEFDPDCELYVTEAEVFFDEMPPYGEKRSLEEEAEEDLSLSQEDIIAYFEKNHIPYTQQTLDSLTAADVYAILAGTFGK